MEVIRPLVPKKGSTTVPKTTNVFATVAATATASKRQPIFLPGFDRAKQLGMDFKNIAFGSAWLRKTYTCDRAKPIRDACLAAEDHHSRDRRLQEARYGNNITLLFKACYTFREFHMSDDFWKALGRIYGVSPEVVKSVVDLFAEARVTFVQNYHPGCGWVRSTATHWADQWIWFLDEGEHQETPPSVSEISEKIDEFFRQEEQEVHGDLARILSTVPDVGPVTGLPTAPRAMRKRAPSPCPLESSPVAKKRTVSTSIEDGTETQATSLDFTDKEEPLDSVYSTNGRKQGEQPYFRFKFHGFQDPPPSEDRHNPKANDCEALTRSNIELQARVESLEKERLESIKAQNDRDNAIRTLQAKFTAFEKASTATNTHVSVNDGLIQKMQDEFFKAQSDRDNAIRTLQAKLTAFEKASAATNAHISVNDGLIQKMQDESVKAQSDRDNAIRTLQAKLTALEKASTATDAHRSTNDELVRKMQDDSAKAQNDRDNAIRKLQARFKALDKASAAVNARMAVNDELVLELEDRTGKLGAQAEKVRKIEEELGAREQTAHSMQTTISSLQEVSTRLEGAWDAQRKELSETLVRVTSLEGKNVLLNDLRKTIQVLESEVEAQKNKATALSLDSANERNNQDARLKATEEALEKQDQIVESAMDRLLVLEDQALTRNARTEALEKRVVDKFLRLESQSLKGNARIESLEKSVMNRLVVLEEQALTRNTWIESLEEQDQTVQKIRERLLSLEDQSLKRNTRIQALEKSVEDRLLVLEDQALARNTKIESLAKQDQGVLDRLLVLEDHSLQRNNRIECLEEQGQTVQRVADRLSALEDQSLSSRIESLENQPDVTKDVPRLCTRLSTVEKTQDDYLKMHESTVQTLRVGLEQTRAEIVNLSKRLATGLGGQALIQHNVSEMETKIAHIEQQEARISKRLETKFSKRLNDMDISREALALQDYAGRIDELSKSLEALNELPTVMAKANDDRAAAFQAELNALYQTQAVANQQQTRAANTNDINLQVVQRLTQKLNKIDWVLEKHMNESREKFDQLVDGDAHAREMERSAKESSDVAAVVDALCRRVGLMENGFEVMRDAICTRRR